MKRILAIVTIIIGIIFTVLPAEAASYFRPGEPLYDKYSSRLKGDWYNTSGNLILSIHGHSINGCNIEFFRDCAGSSGQADGMIAIREDAGLRLLHLSWHITNQKNDFIIVNDTQTLHRSSTDYYYESVHGVHLGMSAKEARSILGNPTFIDSSGYRSKWHYSDSKMVLEFASGSIEAIKLYRGCPYTFDISGLNSDNDIGDFTNFYQYKTSYRGENMSAMQIGNGEYIFFQQVGRWTVGKPVFVELTFYPD